MKIISLNCCLSPWSLSRKKRLLYLIKALKEEGADVILLQEIYFKSDAKYIQTELKKHGFVDCFYSKSLLILSKFTINSRDFYEFMPKFNFNMLVYISEIGNWIYGKGYQIIEIKLKNNSVIILNTHLLSAYGLDYGAFAKARLRQALEICDYLKQFELKKIIFGGDFNFDINSSSYQVIIDNYKFYDAFVNVKGNTITTDNLNRQSFFMAKMDKRIDFIFLKGFSFENISGDIIFKEPYFMKNKKLHISDHYGLVLYV